MQRYTRRKMENLTYAQESFSSDKNFYFPTASACVPGRDLIPGRVTRMGADARF
jgi:hypothetical protein